MLKDTSTTVAARIRTHIKTTQPSERESDAQTRYILDDHILEDVERNLPRPLLPERPFIDLDIQAPPPTRLPANEQWVEILNDAKNEFEFDGATAAFSTWRVEAEYLLDIGDIKIADGIEVRAGRMVLGCQDDGRESCTSLAKAP